MTFDSEDEARRYGEQLDRLLASGIVPEGLLEMQTPKPKEQMRHILRAYINSGHPAKSDLEVLELLVVEVGGARVDAFTYAWCESWVRSLKLEKNLAPGTIRKRIGSLSRAVDWWLRSHPDAMVGNPLKLLPRGAASYSAKDAADIQALAATAPAGEQPKVPKQDVVRDRRLLPGELERIEAALQGHKRPDRERPLELRDGRALFVLFRVIYDTGVRLREAYTLTRAQVDLQGRVLRVQSSKQWHGRVKFRDVPMRRELHSLLTDYLATLPPEGDVLIFPWWDGVRDDATLRKVSGRLSSQFGRVFDYAGCSGLTEHDLRHEATCRWYEMRDQAGGWLFREAEIDKIMGWAPGSAMAKRYASFRAQELIGYAGPTSPDRQPTGSVTMEMPSVAVKDWAEVVREGTTGACNLTHGTVAGNIVQIAMPATQCKPFSLQDDQSNAMINMPFDINPVDGDDELSITVK